MWWDIVHQANSSHDGRCNPPSTSYVLGTILSVFTPIPLLCPHNIPEEADVMIISGIKSQELHGTMITQRMSGRNRMGPRICLT